MKKIMLTLCTLLAVNAGSTMYAGGKPVERNLDTKVEDPTGKGRKSDPSGRNKNEPTADQKANMTKTTSPSQGQTNTASGVNTVPPTELVNDLGIDLNEVKKKSTKLTELNETKNNALTGSVIHQNLNIIKEMNGGKTSLIEPSAESKYAPKDLHDQTFNLDTPSKEYGVSEEMNVKFSRGSRKESGKPIESTRTSKIQKGKDKYETTTTKTTYNKDGSMTETVFKDNPNYNEKAAKDAKLSQKTNRPFRYDVKETIASHSIKYNTDGTVNINRLNAKGESIDSTSLTKEEARQGLQKEVAEKKSSMTDEQTAKAQAKVDQARENAKAAKEAQAKIKENQDKMNQITDIINDPSISVEVKTAKVNEFLDDLQERTGKSDEEIMELKESMDNLISKIDEDQKNSSEQSKQDVTDAKATMIQRITKFINDFIAQLTGRSVATGQAVSTAPVGLLNNDLFNESRPSSTPGDNSAAGPLRAKPISDPGSPKGVDAVDSLDATSEEQGLF